MKNIFHVLDYCRACLRIECSLTPTSALDNDSIKFCDKLVACLSEVMWLKEGLPSLICSTCIDKLRVTYEFRNVCLQSDHMLQRFISRPQEQGKQQNLTGSPLTSPTKFECSISQSYIQEKDQSPQCKQEVLSLEEQSQTLQAERQQQEYHQSQIKQESLQEQQQTQSTLQQFPTHQVNERTTDDQLRPPNPKSAKHYAPDLKPFACSICNKHYRKNSNLRIHMRTYTGEKPFECSYCEKRFYHSSHLREHIRRHTGEKPFQCALCNKRFTIKGELNMHMKSHTGEKPYPCTCCDRRCLTAADLKVHMRTHTGEKPFTCVTCGKKFATTYSLNSHIKFYTGKRPSSCTVCDKTFTQSSQLNVHMRKQTGEKVCCKLCDAKFTHTALLHMRNHTRLR